MEMIFNNQGIALTSAIPNFCAPSDSRLAMDRPMSSIFTISATKP